ncbi:tyrosine-type recombinase/integrase [Leucobacter sp. W1153]|uniref:tyrosine-type recombinase/integrase n=1 Tax=Leucobacter sp. W1153 TaxID=3439064 RepID=UPI003F397088
MTNEEVFEVFLEYMRAGNLAKRTISTRLSILTQLSRHQDVPLVEVKAFHLRREIGRDDLKPASKATMRNVFMAFYTFLCEEGVITENPARRLPIVKVPPHRPRPYTQEQIDKLLSSGAYRRTRSMILLAAYQGLRAAEVAAVHSDDIDLHAGTIKIFGKGGRTDYLPLHPVIRELAASMGPGYWFPARGGRDGHIRGNSVSDLLTDARNRAGITDHRLTGHSLRHTFGTELVRGGANIRAVQELMRHSSLSTTQRYTEVLDDDRRQALDVLPGREIPATSGRVSHQQQADQ